MDHWGFNTIYQLHQKHLKAESMLYYYLLLWNKLILLKSEIYIFLFLQIFQFHCSLHEININN
jgi:hypothetical protein